MKTIILILTILFSLSFARAQSTVKIYGAAYASIWGGAGDTLNISDTLTSTFEIKTAYLDQLRFQLNITKTSGTITNKCYFEGSMDNVNFTKLDSIVNSNASTSVVPKTLSDFSWRYLKVSMVSGATAQRGAYKLYYLNKFQ
jgi:hypothetical protein